MANYEFFIFMFFIAASLQQAFAIRCWQCSNIQGNCGDPFRDDYVSPQAFVDCSLRGSGVGGPYGDSQWSQRLPYGQYGQQWRQPWAQQQPLAQAQIWGQQQQQFGSRQFNAPVCVKAKSITTGLVLRSCANTPQEIQAACSIDSRIADICEICYSDGCNSASRYGSAALMIALPLIIARILST